ncbi:hypothetical protein M3Y97_00312300 [Aphelenchoides bicaudatus]|nr:hypothetical protein M3Y97_00312300 [Aphelenchoides bicaudatus]
MSRSTSTSSSFEILPMYSQLPDQTSSNRLSTTSTQPTPEQQYVLVDRNSSRPQSRAPSTVDTFASFSTASSPLYEPSRSVTPRASQQQLIGQQMSGSRSASVRPANADQLAILQRQTSSRSRTATPSVQANSLNQVALNQPTRTSTPNNQLQQAIGRQLSQLEHSTLVRPTTILPPFPANPEYSSSSGTSRRESARQSIEKPPRSQSSASFRPQALSPFFEPIRQQTPQAQPAQQQQFESLSLLPSPQQPQPAIHQNNITSPTSPIYALPSSESAYGAPIGIRAESRTQSLAAPYLPTHHPQMPEVPLSYVPHPALDNVGNTVYPSLRPGSQLGIYPNIYPSIPRSAQPSIHPAYPTIQPEMYQTNQPFSQPIQPFAQPSIPAVQPTIQPINQPFAQPSIPAVQPTIQPIQPFAQPSIPAVQPIITSPGLVDNEPFEPPPPYELPTNAVIPYSGYSYPPQVINRCTGCSNHFTGPICRPHCCCCRCRSARLVFVSVCGSRCC